MPINNPELTPWPLKASRCAGDYQIFKVRADRRPSPRTGTPAASSMTGVTTSP